MIYLKELWWNINTVKHGIIPSKVVITLNVLLCAGHEHYYYFFFSLLLANKLPISGIMIDQ